MKLPTTYQGADDPFERDRTLWLRSLPAGARVTKATVTLEPKGGPSFQETFVLDKTIEPEPGELPGDKWGVTVTPPGPFVEIDFHARRTLAAVRGTNVTGANLQVDLGGVYAEINKRGAVKAPDSDPFELPADGKLPGLTVSKFKLSREAGTLDVTRVTIRSTPANVSVRLGEMPPFWTHLGDMVTSQTSPDFADVLNAFLAEASAEDGFYAIPFVVHSDSIARLDVTLLIDYVIAQPVLPSYLPEVTLPYGYSSLPGVEEDLLTVKLPRGATVANTGGGVQGAFDATRVVFGEIGESGATARVTVSPGRTLAQPIRLADETPASGVDLPLGNTQPGLAGLHLALQDDADGKPSGEVRTSAEVTVEKPAPGESAWGSAALPAEFRFLKDRRYWLVLQSVSGEAFWDVGPCDPATTPLQASTDGGFSWRTAATDAGEKPLAALFRLRHAPERFSMPVQLQVGKGPDAVRVRFDRFAPLGRVEFDLDFTDKLREYLDSPATASPCDSGNLLVNGDFSDPPPLDDATRELFGFDAKRAVGSDEPATVVGTVDLSGGIEFDSFHASVKIQVDDREERTVFFTGELSSGETVHLALEEIVDTINAALEDLKLPKPVASHDGGHVILTSPSTGAESKLALLAPDGGDVTEDIFGIAPPAYYYGSCTVSAQIIGREGLSDGISLGGASPSIKVQVDAKDPVLVTFVKGRHTRQAVPWTLGEIVTAINDAFESLGLEKAVASDDGTHVILTSPSTGGGSQLALLPPMQAVAEAVITTDVTEIIFGIRPSAHYKGCMRPQIIGTVDLSRGVDLGVKRFITLSVDNASPVRIDCTGVTPARTEPDEIVAAINGVMVEKVDAEVAAYDGEQNALVITSPNAGAQSKVELYACRRQMPHGWQGTPGQVLRYRDPDTGLLFAALLAATFVPDQLEACFASVPAALRSLTGGQAELSQRVPVGAGCSYLLRFYFLFEIVDSSTMPTPRSRAASLAIAQSPGLVPVTDWEISLTPDQLPRWEIEWLDADGASVGTDGETIDVERWIRQKATPPWPHEAVVTAPSAAAQAEVRFIQPSPGVLALGDVSLTPTSEALRDSGFQYWEVEASECSPVVWTHLGGWIDPQSNETGQVIGARLQGGGPEDAVLAQTVEVVAGERYELRVQAQPVGTLADDPETLPDQWRARLELHWLTDGEEIGAPLILPLDGRGFPTHAWAGIAPDGATQAEVRLIQPQGGGELLVESVSLSQVDLVSIPLTFLAEAPGELAVSDLRVAYEPPGPPPEPPPPRPAVQGAPPRQVAAAAPQPPAVRRMVEPSAPRPRSPLADRPIGIIAGVGDRFSDVLGRLPTPVTTVAELAALDHEAEVEGISRERRLELKTKGEMIAAITVEAAPFATLADEPLETLLALPPADLARRAGQPTARTEQLQRDLRALRLVLKNDAFRSLRLSDLMPGR